MKLVAAVICSLFFLLALSVGASAATKLGKDFRAVSSIQFQGRDGGAMLYIGTEHSLDPKHPQFPEIQAAWEQFQPQLLLVEGGDWPTTNSSDDAITKFGEMAYVSYLARKKNVPVRSLEPRFDDEVALITSRYPSNAARLYYALRLVPQWRAAGLDLDKTMSRLLASDRFGTRGGWPRSSEFSVSDLDALLKDQNANFGSWRDVTYEMLSADGKLSRLNEIARASSDFRDQHMATVMIDAVRTGKKVLAITGNQHLRDLQAVLFRRLNNN